MPQAGGESFPYTKKGRSAAQQRQRLLKQRYGQNWRQNFYGDIKGYSKGAVGQVARSKKALASSETPASRRSYLEGQIAELGPVAEQIQARRARFDKRRGIKTGKANVDTGPRQAEGFRRVSGGVRPLGKRSVSPGFTSTGTQLRKRRRRKRRSGYSSITRE